MDTSLIFQWWWNMRDLIAPLERAALKGVRGKPVFS